MSAAEYVAVILISIGAPPAARFVLNFFKGWRISRQLVSGTYGNPALDWVNQSQERRQQRDAFVQALRRRGVMKIEIGCRLANCIVEASRNENRFAESLARDLDNSIQPPALRLESAARR